MIEKYYKYIEFLINELMYIDSMFELYIYLYNQHINRIDTLNISPAFFGLTENAFLESSTIRLSRLFDNDRHAVTIEKFLNFIEQNMKVIFTEEVRINVKEKVFEDKRKFHEFDKKIISLKDIRDTALAHNDQCKLDENFDIWKGKNINIGDIRNLIIFGRDVVNNYAFYSDNKAYSISAINKLDVENILNILEKKEERKCFFKHLTTKCTRL